MIWFDVKDILLEKKNGSSKLTEKDVINIKKRLNNGERPFHIWKDYPQVSDVSIYNIKHNKRWKHIS